MEWLLREPNRGGYQHESAMSQNNAVLDQTEYPRKHQRLRSDPLRPAKPLPEMNEGFGSPRMKSSNPTFEVSVPSAEHETYTSYIVGGVKSIDLNDHNSIEPYEDLFNNSLNRRFEPRISPVDPLISNLSSVRRSNSLKSRRTSSIKTFSPRDSEVHHSSMNKIALPATTDPGPGPGHNPPQTAQIDIRLDTRSQMPEDDVLIPVRKEWEKIQKRRVVTWGLRSKLHEMRKILREKQYAKSAADDRYFQTLRSKSLDTVHETGGISNPQKSLAELLQDCEQARDEYGPLEDDCNLLEDQLGQHEFELTKLEEIFYTRQSESQFLGAEAQKSEPTSPASYNGSEVVVDSHPLVSQYLSKLGDVDIFRERLDWHIEEKESLEYEKDSRQRVGLDLASDDQEWLDNYENAISALQTHITEAEIEAEKLKQLCLARGLVDEAGRPTDFEKQERQTFAGDVDAGSERSEYVKFPLLLPQPGKQRQMQSHGSAPKSEKFSGAGNQINQWILNQLRSSPLDVNLLARTFEKDFGHIERNHWQSDVLAFWYKDGAQNGASEYRVNSSGIATQVPRKSRHSEMSPSNTDRQRSMGVYIPSSSSEHGDTSESGSSESRISDGLLVPSTPGASLSKSI